MGSGIPESGELSATKELSSSSGSLASIWIWRGINVEINCTNWKPGRKIRVGRQEVPKTAAFKNNARNTGTGFVDVTALLVKVFILVRNSVARKMNNQYYRVQHDTVKCIACCLVIYPVSAFPLVFCVHQQELCKVLPGKCWLMLPSRPPVHPSLETFQLIWIENKRKREDSAPFVMLVGEDTT